MTQPGIGLRSPGPLAYTLTNVCYHCIHIYTWSIQQFIVAKHMCWFLNAFNPPMFSSINYFNFIHKDRWCLLSFHIWSAIPDFSISPLTTAFLCSSSLTFSGRPISPLYILPQLQGMEITHFLIMLNSTGGLTRKRYLRRIEPLVNTILMSYGLHILWIDRLVLWHTADNCGEILGIVLYPPI